MDPLRALARPLLASMFVLGGMDSLLKPEGKREIAAPVARPLADRLPGLPDDVETLVRANGAVQVGAGALLGMGRAPRTAALALAGSLVATTAAGHRFWEIEQPERRRAQRIQFFKNASMLGGLLLAAVDREGRPGAAWRLRHRAEHLGTAARRTRRGAGLAARTARAQGHARLARTASATRAKATAAERRIRRAA